MSPEDDVLPAEEQPLPTAVSPTANSPRYIPESDLKEDLEEDDEDPEEDPADYPNDRDDDDEEESFGDEADDEEEDEDEDEEEEEHPALADSIPPPPVTLSPRKRLCIALGLRFEVSKSSSAPTARPTGGFRVDYGFIGTLDDEIRRDPDKEVGYEITDT
nr:hypothetical protein [Tanacetum cinerariifolium]